MCLHLNSLSVIHYFSVGLRQKEANRSEGRELIFDVPVPGSF